VIEVRSKICGKCGKSINQEKANETQLAHEVLKNKVDSVRANKDGHGLLRGAVMTIALRSDCDKVLSDYRNAYNFTIEEEIQSLDIADKHKVYALAPLYEKGWLVKES
jgi:hypothetical protein